MRHIVVVLAGVAFGLLAATTIRSAHATSCSCSLVYEPLTFTGVEELATSAGGDIAYEESRWDVESIGIAAMGTPSYEIFLRAEGLGGGDTIDTVAEAGGTSE